MDAALGEVERAHHRAEVAERHPRRAVVGEDDLPDVVDVLAAPLDLHGRQQQALLVDLGRVAGEAARRLRPDLGHVRDVRDEGDDLALPEDRLQQHVLGHVARAAVGIVVEDDVALLEGVEAELLDRPLDRELDRADLRRAELGLREHVALRVEDDAREVERLVEDRRVGRRHHRHAHVAAAARQVVVDDRQRDRVERRRRASSACSRLDHERALRGALDRHAGLDEERRALLLDHRRPGDRLARLERGAVRDGRVDEPLTRGRRRAAPSARSRSRRSRARGRAARACRSRSP